MTVVTHWTYWSAYWMTTERRLSREPRRERGVNCIVTLAFHLSAVLVVRIPSIPPISGKRGNTLLPLSLWGSLRLSAYSSNEVGWYSRHVKTRIFSARRWFPVFLLFNDRKLKQLTRKAKNKVKVSTYGWNSPAETLQNNHFKVPPNFLKACGI